MHPAQLREVFESSLKSLGYLVVHIHMSRAARPVLQVMIERADEIPITITDCTKASKTIAALLDVENSILHAYHLEVSSPGLDRPLFCPRDYERFCGQDIKLKTKVALRERKKFQGLLKKVTDHGISLECQDRQCVEIPWDQIACAHLIPCLKKPIKS